MNLHELERVNGKACLGEPVMQSEAKGKDPFLPVLPEPPDDVSYMALIDQEVPLKDRSGRLSLVFQCKDILLVFAEDLRIWNDEGWEQCMGPAAGSASDTPDDESEHLPKEL